MKVLRIKFKLLMCSLVLFLLPDPLIQDLKADGKGIFGSECARCHSNENIKEFIQKKWIGQSIMDFFLENKNTMPAGSPGSLTDQEYLHLLKYMFCLLYTSPSPRDLSTSRMPSSA